MTSSPSSVSAATPTQYRAVQATGPGRLELTILPLKEPATRQVRVRIEACGVCHSDALTVENMSAGLTYPRVPGHEIIGRIDALGTDVEDWKVGQRVGVGLLAGPCGRCEECRRGDFVNCRNQTLTGVHHDGGYAESMIADESGLVAVPEELDLAEAAPLLCAGVTTFKALRNSPARPGDLVAILGVGGLGHLAVQFARKMGFKVAAIARGADKEALVKKLGAHVYIDSQAQDAAAALQARGGASIIVATVSDPAAMSPLVGGLRARGRLIVVGAGEEPLAVPTTSLLFGERSLAGTLTGSTIETEDTLHFCALQDVHTQVETVPLAQAPQAYARMMRGEARFRMVLLMTA